MVRLSQEQIELGKLISDGLTYPEIAARLDITPRLAKSRTERLRWSLGGIKKREIPRVMRELGLI